MLDICIKVVGKDKYQYVHLAVPGEGQVLTHPISVELAERHLKQYEKAIKATKDDD